MRYSLIATVVAAFTLHTSSAPAQTSNSATRSKSATPTRSATPSKIAKPSNGASPTKGVKPSKGVMPGADTVARIRAKNYDFLADEIDGDRILPDNTTIFGREVVLHDSLIRLRTEFISEIIKSAEYE